MNNLQQKKIVGYRKLKSRPIEYKKNILKTDYWEPERMLNCSEKIERFHKKKELGVKNVKLVVRVKENQKNTQEKTQVML